MHDKVQLKRTAQTNMSAAGELAHFVVAVEAGFNPKQQQQKSDSTVIPFTMKTCFGTSQTHSGNNCNMVKLVTTGRYENICGVQSRW